MIDSGEWSGWGRCEKTVPYEVDRSAVRQLSDEQLVLLAVSGEVSAFEALVRQFEGRLRHFFEFRIGDREMAQDCCQETWWEVYRSLRTFNQQWRFSTWLFAIARRVAARSLRKPTGVSVEAINWHSGVEVELADKSVAAAHRIRVFAELLSEGRDGPDQIVMSNEARISFWSWIGDRLNRAEYRAIRLIYFHGYSLADTAWMIRRSYGGTKTLIWRAHEKLRMSQLRHLIAEPLGREAASKDMAADGGDRAAQAR